MSSKFYGRRTILRVSGAALTTIGTAGCLDRQPSTSQTVTMARDFAFKPKTATIETGQAVNWKNTSGVEHTVTAYEDGIPDGAAYFASGDFDSERAARNHVNDGLIAPSDEYEYTFEEPGTYGYYCIPHESSGMVGTVQVEQS